VTDDPDQLPRLRDPDAAVFSQHEVDDMIQRRIARERRKLERRHADQVKALVDERNALVDLVEKVAAIPITRLPPPPSADPEPSLEERVADFKRRRHQKRW
jgi:hypothetical protein